MAVPLAEVVRGFGVEPQAIRRIAHRANTHWRVRSATEVFVLRRYRDDPFPDAGAAWEHDLVCDLATLGVPTPEPVTAPRRVGGSLWLLMRHIKGRKAAAGPPGEAGYRWLGRELAALHAQFERLPPRPQRPGWCGFAEAVYPIEGGAAWRDCLLADLRAAAPEMARAFEPAIAALEARDLPAVFAGAPRHAIHSDFSAWNLLVRGGHVSGVLDWELAHVDVLAADLAFARRGYHDAVVDGYLEVRPMPAAQLAALDGLWLGSLCFSLWLILEGWRSDGRIWPPQLQWSIKQLGKTRPYRPQTR